MFSSIKLTLWFEQKVFAPPVSAQTSGNLKSSVNPVLVPLAHY